MTLLYIIIMKYFIFQVFIEGFGDPAALAGTDVGVWTVCCQ